MSVPQATSTPTPDEVAAHPAAHRLYVAVRADLSPGYQIAQAGHAIADWCGEHPEAAETWRQVSNSLVVVTVPDERALYALGGKAADRGIDTTWFREPDLLDEATAIAFTPSPATPRLLSNCPLAGKQHRDPVLGAAEITAAQARERRLRKLAEEMEACEQTPGQDVLAHGRSVAAHYRELLGHLRGTVDLHGNPRWRLPEWVDTYADQLAAGTDDSWTVERYLTIHDCGKPSVLTVDAEGRRRFPGHAEASVAAYREAYGEAADDAVAALIGGDMDIHLLKAAGVPEFAENPHAITHLLAGLAELHSNAAMFGGIESTSFKIKYKALAARGKALCQLLFDTDQDATETRIGGAA